MTNNLYKKDFDIFEQKVSLSNNKNIHLHNIGDFVNEIFHKILIGGNLPMIPKFFFDKDSKTKPVLVAMAGYSVSSFCGSSQIIMENLGLLNRKYKAVYVLCYDEEKFKGFSKRAADERDRQRNRSHPILESPSESLTYREFVFGGDHGEIQMYEELGSIVDKVIRCLGLKNVHLLGKSAGGGTAMNVVNTNPIYTRLYLAVPAHPTYCKSLEKLGNRLNEMKVIGLIQLTGNTVKSNSGRNEREWQCIHSD
jgi:hypothetical protein